MHCTNHPGVHAKRRCYLCKTRICPQCQHRAHRHIFCNEECADQWQQAHDNAQTGELVGQQLEQLLDLTDASLATLSERLYADLGELKKTVQTIEAGKGNYGQALDEKLSSLYTRLLDADQHLRHTIQESSAKLEALMGESLAQEGQHHDTLIERLTSHSGRFDELLERVEAADQQHFKQIDKLREQLRQEFDTQKNETGAQVQETLEQARHQIFKGLERARERMAESLETNHLDVKEFVSAHGDQLVRQFGDSIETLDSYRATLEKTADELQDKYKTSLDETLTQVQNDLRQVHNELFQEAFHSASQTFHEQAKEDLAETVQRHTETVDRQLVAYGERLDEKFRATEQALHKLTEEDLQRITSELKFLDQFLASFQDTAEKQKEEFRRFMDACESRMVDTIAKVEQGGLNALNATVEKARKRFDLTLGELKGAITRRLASIPRKFQFSTGGYVLLGAVLVATLVAPMVHFHIARDNYERRAEIAEYTHTDTPAISPTAAAHAAIHQVKPATTPSIAKTQPASYVKLRRIKNIYRGSTKQKQLSITFDGGSNTSVATAILDILKEKKIRTTIFLTGQFILHNPELTKRIAKDGHEVGNHTWDHPDLVKLAARNRNGTDEVRRQLAETAQLYTAITGKTMSPLWRAPFGSHSDEVLRIAKAAGYTHVHWSDDTLDWVAEKTDRLYRSADEIERRLLNMAKDDLGANGRIVLMHLGSDRRDDYPHKRLSQVIDRLRAQGYSFVRVSQLIQ